MHLSSRWNTEDRGGKFRRNVTTCLSNYTVSYPEECNLNTYLCENLKSRKNFYCRMLLLSSFDGIIRAIFRNKILKCWHNCALQALPYIKWLTILSIGLFCGLLLLYYIALHDGIIDEYWILKGFRRTRACPNRNIIAIFLARDKSLKSDSR
jgi:hypothetical protein